MGSRFQERGGSRGRGDNSRGRLFYRPRFNGNGDRSNDYGRSNGYGDRSNGYTDHQLRTYRSNAQPSHQTQPTARHQDDNSRSRHQGPAVKDREPDLHSVLSEISKTLASLAGRVEAIEKNKGPDSNSARVIRPPQTAVPAGPILHNSNNNDFASVSKALYKIVQIGHHAANWERLPKSIDARLKRLIADIRPPMCDADFTSELSMMTQAYGEEIRRLVADHLQKKQVEVEMSAGSLDATDVNHAKQIASKYITSRLGKRLTDQRRTELIDTAASKVGVHRQAPPRTAAPETASAWQTIARKTPPTAGKTQVGLHDVSRKRKDHSTGSTPVSVSNRFESLNGVELISEDELEPTDTPKQQQSSYSRPSAKKQRQLFDDVITPDGVHIFAGNKKEDWHIKADTPDTSVIVIGDSNLRRVRIIPQYWQVNSLPGANLNHVAGALSPLTGKPRQFTIVIQAGINHRSQFSRSDEDDIRSMLFDVRRNPAVAEIFFNGVSIPSDLDSKDSDRLNNLNRFMEEELGRDHYIPPLQQADVQVMQYSQHPIHYDQETVDRISRAMVCHVTGSDF
jgi:hypothetical protein